jgi:hypothetical protein
MDALHDDRMFDAGWLKLRDELAARIDERFGPAFKPENGDAADPDLLADLALERAFML